MGSSCPAPVFVFEYPKADWDGLCNYLMDCDFSLCYEESDVEAIWSVLKRMVTSAMHLFIPRVQLRKFQLPRWFTPDLRHKHKCCLQYLERKCSRSPSFSNLRLRKNSGEKLSQLKFPTRVV